MLPYWETALPRTLPLLLIATFKCTKLKLITVLNLTNMCELQQIYKAFLPVQFQFSLNSPPGSPGNTGPVKCDTKQSLFRLATKKHYQGNSPHHSALQSLLQHYYLLFPYLFRWFLDPFFRKSFLWKKYFNMFYIVELRCGTIEFQ